MVYAPILVPRELPLDARVAMWRAEPESRGAELLGGRIVYKAMPDPRHGETQGLLFGELARSFHRRRGEDDHPGGWWLSQEVEILLGDEGVRPDLCGWRREEHPTRPVPGPLGVVTDVPDWIGEVLSPSTSSIDRGEKMSVYFRAGVAHYWLVDPAERSVTVLRRVTDGYLVAGFATVERSLCAEPFDEATIDLTRVFVEG